jgi:hypothetical protein
MILVGYDLYAQNSVNSARFDTIMNGKLLSFDIVGIADTIKANTKGFILDCTDSLSVWNATVSFWDSMNNKLISYCNTDTSGLFNKWIDYGRYDIKIQMVGYYNFKIKGLILKSGNLITMKGCLIRQPEEIYPEPVVLPYDSKRQK